MTSFDVYVHLKPNLKMEKYLIYLNRNQCIYGVCPQIRAGNDNQMVLASSQTLGHENLFVKQIRHKI